MSNPHKGRTGIDRIVHAAGFSLAGLAHAPTRGKAHSARKSGSPSALLPLSCWIGRGWVETALLAGSVMLVLIVELLNSGIEAAIDRVSFEWHELSRRAKDLASAAVMLSLLTCGTVWIAALWQRFA